MIMDFINDIRNGKIDINNQQLFFSTLIKGLILSLNDSISIRNTQVPHIILHMGDDIMYLENKGYDNSIEPYEVSNEDYIYNIIPRCNVTPGGIDLLPDQLTNPYTIGQLEYDNGDGIYLLKGEFRRISLKLGIELKYYVSSFRDQLELVQQIISKLTYIRTFNITYMGQVIMCSYKIPESFSGEHLTELSGDISENKLHTLPISIEVETNFPVYTPETIMDADNIIRTYKHNIIESKHEID